MRLRAQSVSFDTRDLPDRITILDDISIGLTGVHGPRIIHQFTSVESETSIVARFTHADSYLIEQFVDAFAPLLIGLPNLYEELESALAELMDNVFAHSESPEGGFLVGKHYTDRHVLRFAVCDLGISIPRHLRRMEPEYINLPDDQVMSEAFVLGVSGNKSTRFGSGLPTVSDVTMRLGGLLRAYSGKAIYCVKSETVESISPEKRFPGTLMSIEWPTVRVEPC
jgi:anti-sigma regulatory factor (Ser/Thr protein kinase)